MTRPPRARATCMESDACMAFAPSIRQMGACTLEALSEALVESSLESGTWVAVRLPTWTPVWRADGWRRPRGCTRVA